MGPTGVSMNIKQKINVVLALGVKERIKVISAFFILDGGNDAMQRLYCEVICLAINDVHKGKLSSVKSEGERRKVRADARRFFTSTVAGIRTFPARCEMAGLDAVYVKRKMVEYELWPK